MTEYLLCAAVWFDINRTYVHQPKNITNGYVVYGRRHHNCFASISILSKRKHKKAPQIQGFLTNTDRFVGRKEAAEIAYNAGQIKVKKETLYSEDLW